MTAKRTGLKWTEYEDRFLLRYYKIMSDKEIADMLNRTERAVKQRREGKKLLRPVPCPKCNETIKIGVVSTYIQRENVIKPGFFCKNCLTEYLKNGRIIPPYEEGKITKKQIMFELLDEIKANGGVVIREQIMREVGIASSTFSEYKKQYKEERCINE